MLFGNLDMIVKNRLLSKRLPLHFYLESLVHAANCIRQLNIDTLKIINTVELTVNSYGAIDLPDDFMDDVGLALPVGGLLQPIHKKDSITPIRYRDSTGAFVAPTNDAGSENQFWFNPNQYWLWNVNEFGESTGRYFGANGGAPLNGWKVIKERRQIQLTGTFTSDTAVLMYISDGQNPDNATMVDMMAFDTINSYSDWQASPNATNIRSAEAYKYFNDRRILRARLNPITVADIKNILYSSYTAAIKT
jgi:hypothetical protein